MKKRFITLGPVIIFQTLEVGEAMYKLVSLKIIQLKCMQLSIEQSKRETCLLPIFLFTLFDIQVSSRFLSETSNVWQVYMQSTLIVRYDVHSSVWENQSP